MSSKKSRDRIYDTMDIVLLDKASIKLKTRNATFVINPTSVIPKTEASASLSFEGKPDTSKIEGSRVSISAPGEYEISGIKITGIRSNGKTAYLVDGDGLKLLFGKFSSLESLENFPEIHIGVFDVDTFKDNVLIKIEPRVTLLYGEARDTALKELCKNEKISKYSITLEKLPEENQVIGLN